MWDHVAHNTFKAVVPLHVYESRQSEKMSFETPLLISVKNVDLQSGLEIIESLSKHVPVSEIIIRRSSEHV